MRYVIVLPAIATACAFSPQGGWAQDSLGNSNAFAVRHVSVSIGGGKVTALHQAFFDASPVGSLAFRIRL
ncbi:MAG: hypothetical protein BRD40_03670 [Bacteroidetes bacterium QS_1_65_9]|nr:MAG: hypothetical protein BRD40_03670 [Bacteroidetes bacterium QS_1_65_9]